MAEIFLIIDESDQTGPAVKDVLKEAGLEISGEYRGDEVLTRLAELDAELADDGVAIGEICREALPIWSRQIEMARTQAQDAINAMVGQFTRMLDELASLPVSRQSGEGDARRVRESAADDRGELSQLIETLHTVQRGQAAVVEELRHLSGYTGHLTDMANQMKLIAWQTKLMALNSAIQAAHAGAHGKGLAVISNEIHLLSGQTGDTSRRMGEIAEAMSSAIDTAARTSTELSERDRDAVSSMAGSTNGVIENLDGITRYLTASTDRLQCANAEVRREIENVLSALGLEEKIEFLDRIAAQLGDAIGTGQ